MKKEQLENINLITLDESFISQMAQLYKRSFAGEPWNDDWTDNEQLLQYIAEISNGYNALNFGLLMDGELVALSVGEIRHWWEGTNYNIEEFCVDPKLQGQGIGSCFMRMIEVEVKARGLAGIFLQTDSDKPALSFYHKNGFNNLDEHVSLYKNLRAMSMTLETQRLILRPWKESDAEDLYRYASDPDVGPIAGWPPHQSIEESLDIIKNVLSGSECYAICLKEDGKAIGAIELKLNGHTDMTERDDECELGYWLGKPFWGQSIMPEAAREIIRHGFEEAGMTKIWCGYYEGNTKSKRVQEKVGFKYQWKSEGVDVPLMQEKRTGHVSSMTKEEWLRL
jgi:RimJ/RimL family protein N-acetyltransferase/ribosomal protein S18 acetylase RimI-like enzyme